MLQMKSSECRSKCCKQKTINCHVVHSCKYAGLLYMGLDLALCRLTMEVFKFLRLCVLESHVWRMQSSGHCFSCQSRGLLHSSDDSTSLSGDLFLLVRLFGEETRLPTHPQQVLVRTTNSQWIHSSCLLLPPEYQPCRSRYQMNRFSKSSFVLSSR
jgi:hypothetical protein